MIDIGGGSIELTVADSNKIYFCTSQKLGFLRMHNRFVSSDPINDRDGKLIQDYLESKLASPLSAIRKLHPQLIVATSGTATTMLRIAQRSQPDSKGRNAVTVAQISSVLKTASRTALSERASELDLDVSRAMYFPTALLCLKSILDGMNEEQCIVSPDSLREGLVYDFIETSAPGLKLKGNGSEDSGYQSVLTLASRCGYPQEHSRQVVRIADQVFLQTRSLHGLGEKERRLLKHASLLHDIGYHISYYKHHKHGAYLIMNGELSGCSPEERQILAHVVRYHRGAKPRLSHDSFAALPKQSQQIIKNLAAILRIADSLDRSHSQLVERIECVRDGNTVEFRVLFKAYAPDMYLDLDSAKERSRYFAKLFGLEARFANLGVQPATTQAPAVAKSRQNSV